ncbi:MAG TPA: RNA chaperone Hfq [Microvirga sp.]|nr:RNA chaperone Hfq [Microvirga sp.]
MAEERSQNLQDTFLKHVRDHSVPVTMFLVNGVRLQGYISHFDKFGVFLTRDGQTQFVYKHAISAVSPLTPIQLFTGPEEDRT